MAWVKIPKEHHPIFLEALPRDPRVESLFMFGGLAAKVNGNMFAGLFGRSYMVKLSAPDLKAALASGAVPFDPIGNGRVMGNSVQMPDDALDDGPGMRKWIDKAFQYAATLPKKVKGKPAPKKAASKKAASKKAAPKKAAPKKKVSARPKGSKRR